MDCSIVPSKKYDGLFVVSTVDFFYPLVEDPYLQGRIAACNVLSDMYSMGIDTIDNVLMTLAASDQMEHKTRRIVTEQMMKGFGDLCKEAGTTVTGGQTIMNPWPIIGGVAKSILKEQDFIRPQHAVAGDVLVLTKPLGTQLAVNMREWLHQPERKQRLLELVTTDEVDRAFSIAQASMGRLNRDAARLMHKYQVHAGTDITGFGILGHADNLAKNQKEPVRFVIEQLPCIASTMKVADSYPVFKLREGYSAETSGGLLIALPASQAEGYCKEIHEAEGWPAWVIGRVEASTQRVAVMSPGLDIIEVGN
eukprot:gnl/MRDRNA2_/MRDRNA2_116082_c0_seq1.p1 gnl/MRDRNA2_/MRDRNA2_116082_c0~~gnl/MRDRNA2_/MRDRNA2_116082_c0_seq1.p1  ORF type:complete len:309 (-),score=58.65 gnl/MRDRNA2_/MRDRNA2_116082_c0_seq1:197-1123(-)